MQMIGLLSNPCLLCIVIKQYVCYYFRNIKSGQGSIEQFDCPMCINISEFQDISVKEFQFDEKLKKEGGMPMIVFCAICL